MVHYLFACLSLRKLTTQNCLLSVLRALKLRLDYWFSASLVSLGQFEIYLQLFWLPIHY